MVATGAQGQSTWGTIALIASAVSLIGLVVLFVGDLAGWEGFEESDQVSSTAGDVAWVAFTANAIVALAAGVGASMRGSRDGSAADTRAGLIGIGWFVAAVLLLAIFSALG
jgi:uncharacterized membrane protein